MKELVIWGCGGHAREVKHLCDILNLEVVGFLDEREEMKGKVIDGVPVLGDLEDISLFKDKVKVVCAGVGNPNLKKKFVIKTINAGFKISDTLIHPLVYISKKNTLGIGSIICEGAILTTNISVGDFVIINRGSNISHDNIINDYVTISPGVNIAGNVIVDEGAYIGIGSSIREKTSIGAWAVIGGGAFVKNDIPAKTMYVGVPAKFKKFLQ